ncbi:MAG TPA: hypothetical protein VFT98_17550 [Myxococcota bacterium]|nr:hypothetical protein [Myxococcota bacterium]
MSAILEPLRERERSDPWAPLRRSVFRSLWIAGLAVESRDVDPERRHARITTADRAVQQVAITFHRGAEPPRIRHFIHERVREGS